MPMKEAASMRIENDDRCGTCLYWRHHGGDFGCCQRHAPRPRTVDETVCKLPDGDYCAPKFVAVWPETGNDEWCGDYAPTRA